MPNDGIANADRVRLVANATSRVSVRNSDCRCQYTKNAADIQIPTAYKKALKLKLFRTENKGGSPSGSAAIARFRALLSFVFYCVALFVAGA